MSGTEGSHFQFAPSINETETYGKIKSKKKKT